MMKGEFIHHPHGEPYHDTAIMCAKSICSQRGYTFLDPRPFKDKGIYPGDPDVCIRVANKTGFMNYVIEIETNPTKVSITKKTAQFQADGVTDLIIVDMRILSKKRDWKDVKLGELIAFLEKMIP
jgi:hypothetical protein